MPTAAPYAARLRLEGLALAAVGTAASVALVKAVPASRRWPLNTAAQLALTGWLVGTRGPRSVDRWMDQAEPCDPATTSGEPTPLWHVPVPVVAGAALFKGLERVNSRAGWDASLRVTAGSAIVGLAQAFVLAPRVRARERAQGATFFRLPGSTLGTGTRLGVATT